MASQNLLNAKKHLELLDENSSSLKTSSVKNDFHSIMDDFITFEKDIESIVENTQKYKFRIHYEIKTPIIRIQYLLGKLSTSENISNDEKETLTSIQNNIKSMKDTAEKILLLSKIQNAQLQTSEIDINQNITNIIEDIEHQHNTLIECNINSKKSMQADPLLINIVWQNMISNSIKYAHPDRKLKINIETNIQDNEMIIDYTDNGIGINRNELNSAADTRDRIMNNNSNKIGLNIIQTIIEKHGGDFKIVDSSIHGSKFRITLP
ncbi:MAG: HAMP domain-containing histidine kinase [Saprospiraceae bacterium]|nr:HAMP domain-containing histidine kinase [Saprospiraceae bacterium]